MMAMSALAAMEWSPMVFPPREDFLVRDLVMDRVYKKAQRVERDVPVS